MRVAAYASLRGSSPTVEAIEPKLRDLIQEDHRRTVSIEIIQKRVAEMYDLRPSDMTSKKRPASIARPRQIAMYLARRLTKSSLQEIGEAFGGRDHGTVLHACSAVAERIATDSSLKQKVEYLEGTARIRTPEGVTPNLSHRGFRAQPPEAWSCVLAPVH